MRPHHSGITAQVRPESVPRYDYNEARAFGLAFAFTLHVRSRGEEKKELESKPGVRARRWAVERTHGWMNRFRRILFRWDIREDTYFAMLHFTCGIIAWRDSGLLKSSLRQPAVPSSSRNLRLFRGLVLKRANVRLRYPVAVPIHWTGQPEEVIAECRTQVRSGIDHHAPRSRLELSN